MRISKIFNLIKESNSIRNSGWIIWQQVFQMILQLLVGVFTARYLGPNNYGALNYTASFVTFFTAISALGMDSVVIKKMIYSPDDEGKIIGSCMILRLISSILSIFSVSMIVFVLNMDEPIKLILVLLQSIQLSFKAIQILDSWFQRHLKSKYVSIGKMVACVVVSSYRVALLVLSKNIIWFAISNSLTDAVIAFVEFLFYKKNNGPKLHVDFKYGMGILKESYHFIISGVMVAIYSQMDQIMIGQFIGDKGVGLYASAMTICSMWVFVPTAIITSFQPVIMELKKQQSEVYLKRLKQLYSCIIWLCIAVSLIIALFGPLFIRILYGIEYIGASSTLRILIWSETFSMIGTARSIWIICENKNKYVKYYLLIGVFVNFFLNFLLIPKVGIEGAAIATLMTQIVTSIIAPLLFRETKIHSKLVLEAFVGIWR